MLYTIKYNLQNLKQSAKITFAKKNLIYGILSFIVLLFLSSWIYPNTGITLTLFREAILFILFYFIYYLFNFVFITPALLSKKDKKYIYRLKEYAGYIENPENFIEEFEKIYEKLNLKSKSQILKKSDEYISEIDTALKKLPKSFKKFNNFPLPLYEPPYNTFYAKLDDLELTIFELKIQNSIKNSHEQTIIKARKEPLENCTKTLKW